MVPSSYFMGTLNLVASSHFESSIFFSFSAISSMCCKKLMNSKGLQDAPTPTSGGEINKRETSLTRSDSMVVSKIRTEALGVVFQTNVHRLDTLLGMIFLLLTAK